MVLHINHIKFKEIVAHYYSVLKEGYLKEIEQASDQQYAKQYFQRILFLESEHVPYQSILFKEIQYAYKHFNCLNERTAIERTFELLLQIKKVSKKRLAEAIAYLEGDRAVFLADWYMEQINSGNSTLEELILIETKALKSSKENLFAALALDVAGKRLYREFNETNEILPTSPKKHQHSFTRNEQMLALYFLIQSFGVNLFQVSDRTKLAALFHLIMGVPFESKSKLKDLAIYKGLSSIPSVVSNNNQLLKYLLNIRPYFENANFDAAVRLIDKEIQNCQSGQD